MVVVVLAWMCEPNTDTQSEYFAFQHLPPKRSLPKIGYATEGALFLTALLSTDAVSALRKDWVGY